MKIDYFNMLDIENFIKKNLEEAHINIEDVFQYIEDDILIKNIERIFIEENYKLGSTFHMGKVGNYIKNKNTISSDNGLISLDFDVDEEKTMIHLSFLYFNDINSHDVEMHNYVIGEESETVGCQLLKQKYILDEVTYMELCGLEKNIDDIANYIESNYIMADDQDEYSLILWDGDYTDITFFHNKSSNEIMFINDLDKNLSYVTDFEFDMDDISCVDVLLRTIDEYNNDIVSNKNYPKILTKHK